MNYGPVEGGDSPVRRLDTAVVDDTSDTLRGLLAEIKAVLNYASEGGE